MTWTRGARQRRGQAAVEAALGTLVWVTVILFGIHFAEVGYLSVKVTEAANFATFDATGRQMHQYTSKLNTNKRSVAVINSKGAANGRYGDWSGDSGGGAAPRAVFTTASGLNVDCQVISGPGGVFPTMTVGSGLGGVYQNVDQGGMECWAEGQVEITGIGSFHDNGGGFFKQDHIASGQTTIKICSTGRAWSGGGNGACVGKVPIVLGDWSLSDTANNEANECDLYNCNNNPYKDTVETAFNTVKGPTGAGTTLAAAVAGYGTDEGAYWFAWKGEENGFVQKLNGVHAGPDSFTVTPGGDYEVVKQYKQAHSARQACFLGFPCNWKYSTHN